MDAVMRERETPMPDFSATIIEPPRRVAPQPFMPPAAVTEVQTAGRETTHIQQPAGVALPSPPAAPLSGKRRRKIGFAFVILVLFLMFLVFILALVLD